MQYREGKYQNRISILGYGCMRFTKKGGRIDIDKAEKELMAAINGGVNYLDTAYIYPGSEAAVGEILERNQCRNRVYIATKLPQYLIKSESSLDKYFDEQLKRLRTKHIDYYLMHMLTDIAAWEKLCKLGIKEWIEQKKKAGSIKNIGFSFHGNTEMFLQILEAYDWDFCQIQYNYMDEHSQAGRKGLQAAAAKGIPVIIMEPLRGGKLVDLLPESAKRRIKSNERGWSPAEWAFRWLWNQAEVTCVLSGMSSLSMVKENVRAAKNARTGEFTKEDFDLIEDVKSAINGKIKVGCTGCGYCMPCPRRIDIPTTFRCYNRMYTENANAGRVEYAQMVAFQKEMSDIAKCAECGKCEAHCPQHLNIRKEMKIAQKKLLPWHFRAIVRLVRMFKFW